MLCKHCGRPVHRYPVGGPFVHAEGLREWCRDGKHKAEPKDVDNTVTNGKVET